MSLNGWIVISNVLNITAPSSASLFIWSIGSIITDNSHRTESVVSIDILSVGRTLETFVTSEENLLPNFQAIFPSGEWGKYCFNTSGSVISCKSEDGFTLIYVASDLDPAASPLCFLCCSL